MTSGNPGIDLRPSSEGFGQRSIWLAALSFTIVSALSLYPILAYEFPPFVDYPNHLARHYISSAISGSDTLSAYYDFEWRWLPNIGADVLAFLASHIAPIYQSGQIVISLSIVMWLIAASSLHWVLWRQLSALPLFSVVICFNANLAWGFENYFLSSSLAVIAFSIWIYYQSTTSPYKFVFFFFATPLVYLSHMVAFGLLVVLVLLFEANRPWQETIRQPHKVLKRCLPLLIPAVLCLLHFLALNAMSPPTHGSGTAFGGIASRLQLVASPAMLHAPLIDAVILAAAYGLLCFGLLKQRWLVVHDGMKLLLLALGLLTLIVPYKIMGVYHMNIRLPFVLVILLIASCRFSKPGLRSRQLLFITLSAMLALRLSASDQVFRTHSAEVGELIAGFQSLERGARLLPVRSDLSRPWLLHRHSSSYAVIERQAYLPTLFTGAHLLRVKPAFRDIDVPHDSLRTVSDLDLALAGGQSAAELMPGVSATYWKSWWKDYSHILLFDRDANKNPFPDHLTEISRGSFFVLYRVDTYEN